MNKFLTTRNTERTLIEDLYVHEDISLIDLIENIIKDMPPGVPALIIPKNTEITVTLKIEELNYETR